MSDGLAMRLWPYQDLPRFAPEPAEEHEPGRVPGLIDESN